MNLQKQILVEHSAKNAETVATIVENNPDVYLKELIDLILLGDKLTAQRAAWSLAKFSPEFYIELVPYLDFILEEVKNAKHVAVSRNFARVFRIITNPKNDYPLSDTQIDAIAEVSFSFLIDPEEKAAVIAFSMFTLQNLIHKRSWIAPELKIYVENNISGGLPSFQSVGRKILKSINSAKK
ncbi:MAG: hypothetical protein ABFR62_11790 [Bacteroidota bacterium]